MLGSSPTRASARSISSWVRFLDWRKAIRLSMGDAATEGSWRTVLVRTEMSKTLRRTGECVILSWKQLTIDLANG